MKRLVVRFLQDTSGSTSVLSQALLVTGSSLVTIPTVNDIGAELNAIFLKLAKSLH